MADITIVHDVDVARRAVPAALEGDYRDCYLEEITPDTPHGAGGTTVAVGVASVAEKVGYERRGLLLYDLNAFLPADATITAAVWWIYAYTADTNPDHAYYLQRCTRVDWLEAEATWNSYKTGSAWSLPGGDFANPTIGPLSGLTTAGWKSHDVLAMVSDAWDNRSGICAFIMRRNDASMAEVGEVYFYAKEMHPNDPAYPPHLRVTYTLDGRTFQAFIQ